VMTPQPLTERIGVRILVGGYGLRLVDADAGRAQSVARIPADATHTTGELVRAGDAVYALAGRCDAAGGSRVYRIRNGTAEPLATVPADDLLAGPNRVWAVNYTDQNGAQNKPVVLRRLDGGRPLTLQPNAYPVADTDSGIVVATGESGQVVRPPRISVLDSHTGRQRIVGVGAPLAAERDQLLVVQGSCIEERANTSCTLVRVDLATGRQSRRYALPDGRVPASGGRFSADGQLVAFQLSRATPDPRFDADHPIPPSDLAVLQVDSGRLDIVPGLELAPKTAAGLAFGPAPGNWLFATVSDGDHAHLLAWHPGLSGPQSVARLDGPVPWAPPLLVA
jgi:hypothetical protein